MYVGVVMPIRECNEYLPEWVVHHLNIGFDRIILIDNNEIDGPNPLDVLQEYRNKITYVDIRGNHECGRQNNTNSLVYKQMHKAFDWLAFWDSDEFLFLNQDSSVKEWLSRHCFDNADVVAVNWRMMSDNNLIYKDSRPRIERFTEYCPDNCKTIYNTVPQNWHIKSIVRCRRDDVWFSHPHFPRANTRLLTYNAAGNPIPPMSPFTVPDYSLAELRHYQVLSTQEFCENRLTDSKRYVNGKRYDGISFDNSKEIAGYFKMCTWTPEKQAYIDNYCKEHGLPTFRPTI